MLFQSYEFAFFLAGVLLLYYLVPGKIRPAVIVLANLAFFCAAAPQAVVWLLITILTTYGAALWAERTENKKKKYGIAAGCVLLNLLLLVVFRYFPVWDDLINAAYGKGIRRVKLDVASDWGLIAPLGISFYTLQAIGYLADVTAGKYKAEKSLLRFAAFVSFFPSLSSGPIERGNRFLPQLERICSAKRCGFWQDTVGFAQERNGELTENREKNPKLRPLITYDEIGMGLIAILWGFFLKMVIADRAAILVDLMYSMYINTDSFTMLMAALFYSVQIFCDFASYSAIAVGTAQLMGFSLIRNFRQPYLAVGFQDFWNRWHVSLSSWLRDYVYIPLGGNRKGVLRRYGNILITFLVSGLWHGGAPQFLVWGLLHGMCQVVEDLGKRCGRALMGMPGKHKNQQRNRGNKAAELCLGEKVFHVIGAAAAGFGKIIYGIFTFGVVTILWIFFRSDSLDMALVCLENLFAKPQGFLVAEQLIFVMGLDKTEFLIAVAAIGLLLVFEIVSRMTKLATEEWIYRSPLPIRWVICLFLIGAVFVVGKYGVGFDASNFIYMGF